MIVLTAAEKQQKAQQFINEVFAGCESGGYISLVEVPAIPDLDQADRWKNLRTIYLAMRPGIVPQLPEMRNDSSWYFSPVLYSVQNKEKTNVIEGSVLWADVDNPKITPYNVLIRPSVAIETSEGRYHLYWILTGSLDPANIEYYNKRIAYAIGADKSGWDANQLLRLPIGQNMKREPACPVKLIIFEPELKYTLDSFAILPELPVNLKEFPQDPLPVTPKDRLDLLEKYTPIMSARMVDLLRRRTNNRSEALWNIYNEAARANIPAEDCFWLVKGSPNDKYTEQRYAGNETLWRDILGAYSLINQGRKDRGVIAKLSEIRLNKEIPHMERLDQMGTVLIDDMRRIGMFYQTKGGSELYYLDLTQGLGKLINVELRSLQLRKLLLDRYAVNPGTQEYMQLFEHVAARCQDDEPVQVHHFSYFDPAACVLYINKYDNSMYRVTSKGYEIVPNGSDGVLFLNPTGADSFIISRKPEEQSTVSLWDKLVLQCANLIPSPDITNEEVRHILYSWVLALFFKNLFPVKPIILIRGETGSGKTMLFKAVLKVLIGAEARPDAPYENKEAFDNAVSNAEYVFVDNVDDYLSWLANSLALVATGYAIVKRKLYTNNEQFTAWASCFVGITSRNAKFLRERDDVVERIIAFTVQPHRDKMINESALIGEILDNRSYLWGELVEDLMKLLKQLEITKGKLPKFQGDFRQADFGSFLTLTCADRGIDPYRLYEHIKKLQGSEAMQDSPLLYVLQQWLAVPGKAGKEYTSAKLHIELSSMPGGEEFHKRIPSPRGLAVTLARNSKYLESVGIKVEKVGTYSPLYKVTLIDY